MTSRLDSNGAIVRPSSNSRRQAIARAAASRAVNFPTDLEHLSNPQGSFNTIHAPTRRPRNADYRRPPQTQSSISFVVKAYNHYPNQAYKRVNSKYIGSYSDLEKARAAARKDCKRITECAGGWNCSWREHDSKWFLKAKDSRRSECWTIVIKMRWREPGPGEKDMDDEEEKEEEGEEEESAAEESSSENESAEEQYSYVLKVHHRCDHFDQDEDEVLAVYSDLATANKAARKEYRTRCEDLGTEPDYRSARNTAQDGRTSYKLEWEGEGIETWDVHLDKKPRR